MSRLARGASVQLGGKILGRGTGLLAQVAVSRMLGPAGYGIYVIGWTVFQITGLLASLGLEHGVVRFASPLWRVDDRRLKTVVRRSLWLALGSGLAAGLVLSLAAPALASRLFGKPSLLPVLVGFAVGLAPVAGLRVAAAASRVSQRMGTSTLAEDLAPPAAQLLLLGAFFAAGWRLVGAVAAAVLAVALGLALALRGLSAVFPGWLRSGQDAAPVGSDLLAFSLPTCLAGALGSLTMSVDRLLVGYYLPPAQNGFYGAAVQIPLLFVVILTAFNAIFSPMIAELYHQGKSERLAALYRVGTKWSLYLAVPPFLVILLFSRELVVTIFGPSYLPAALPMMVLAGGQMANLASGAVGFLLVMSGRQGWWLGLCSAALVVNAVLAGVWIPRFGVLGAALATACTLTALFSSALALVHRSMRLWPWDRRFLKGLAAAATAAAGLAVVKMLGVGSPFLVVVIASAVAMLVFVAVLAALGFDPEDRELVGWAGRRSP